MNPTIIGTAIANIIEHQPWYMRRKATILLTLTTIIWALALITPLISNVPQAVTTIIAIIAGVAATMYNALTKDGITPSAEGKIIEAIGKLPAPTAGLDDIRAQLSQSTTTEEPQGDTQ